MRLAAAIAALALCLAATAEAASENERLIWRKAEAANLASGYEDYLRRFPGGDFVPFARARLSAWSGGPVTAAPLVVEDPAAAEAALDLGPAERMAAQEGLAARGFYAGPIDGLFGPPFRDALRAWQIRAGERATGHLTGRQYDELTTAPLSGALDARGAMTQRLDLAEDDAARAAREAALGYEAPELAEIEARLARLGFDPGPADGAIDAAARAAVRAYRQVRGFTPHGFLDRPMVDRLFRDGAGWPGPRPPAG